MKHLITLTVILFFLGCASQTQNRQKLISRFQAAYPNTWQQKLLEYDIEQGNLKSYQTRTFADYLQAFLEARKQHIIQHPNQIITRPQIINPHPDYPSTEYQERYYRKLLYGY